VEVAHREYGYWMREIVDCPGVNYGRVTRSLRELEVGKKGECMIARPDPPPSVSANARNRASISLSRDLSFPMVTTNGPESLYDVLSGFGRQSGLTVPYRRVRGVDSAHLRLTPPHPHRFV